jgi:outer membrane protein
MKNINSIITTILTIAVAVLFYLHFSAGKKNTVVAAAPKAQNSKGILVAYFEMDSIQNQYEYYKDVVKDLSAKEQDVRSRLDQLKKTNQTILREYQNKFKDLGASGGNISEADKIAATKAQQDLQDRDKNYQVEEQRQASALSDESRSKLAKVKETIEGYLKEYNKNNVYAFILANSADLMYYKDSSYNITNEVIKGLNDNYKKKK